jgi:hypothetical protein
VRDTLERCLGDKKRNWSYRAIHELLLRKHRYSLSIMGVSDYRKRWLAQLGCGEVREGRSGRTTHIRVPAGAVITITRAARSRRAKSTTTRR